MFLQKTENNSRTTDNNKTVKTKDFRNEIGRQKVLLKLCLRKQTAELKFKMRIRVCKDLTVQLPRSDSKSETDKLRFPPLRHLGRLQNLRKSSTSTAGFWP